MSKDGAQEDLLLTGEEEQSGDVGLVAALAEL